MPWGTYWRAFQYDPESRWVLFSFLKIYSRGGRRGRHGSRKKNWAAMCSSPSLSQQRCYYTLSLPPSVCVFVYTHTTQVICMQHQLFGSLCTHIMWLQSGMLATGQPSPRLHHPSPTDSYCTSFHLLFRSCTQTAQKPISCPLVLPAVWMGRQAA